MKKLTEAQSRQIAYHAEIMTSIYDAMKERDVVLHVGQIRLARDLFSEGKRVIQAQWGRKAGKTETACYLTWIFALLNPGSQIWIICPQRKQGKDIYWLSGRIQGFGPRHYIESDNTTDLCVNFKNTSFIKVDGCENYNALRGINPSLVLYDEFQEHSKEFHVEVMAPNLIAKDASLVVIGTPPRSECYYDEFKTQLLSEIKAGDTSRAYYEFPSDINPSLDKKELEKIRIRLEKAGDTPIWQREYLARSVRGGEGTVFLSWDRERHIKSHELVKSTLERDMKGLKWYTIFDPGNMTCFGVLFLAYNPYTSQVFILDEIYETNPRHTDATSIWLRTETMEQELYPGHPYRTWKRVYDHAASWFYINVKKMFPRSYMTPCVKNTQKFWSSKEEDCSLIKQIMAVDNVLFVSERCQKFIWEVENYVVDENGNYPDENDHLIDCFVYFLKACGFRFVEQVPAVEGLASQSVISAFGVKRMRPAVKDPSEWSDNVVDDSLWIDIYNEYFH